MRYQRPDAPDRSLSKSLDQKKTLFAWLELLDSSNLLENAMG
jgi:hypothetical protein